MTDPDLDEEPAEHGRYRRYLQDLDGIAEADKADLVTTVLRDPVMSMAQAAVNHHLERRAAQLLTDPAFTAWAQMMATAVADRSFLTRRLSEWTLLRAIALDEPWTAEDLTTASDWFQRTASTAQIVTSSEVLSLLAERGRTRRVRNAASSQLQRWDQQPRSYRFLPAAVSGQGRRTAAPVRPASPQSLGRCDRCRSGAGCRRPKLVGARIPALYEIGTNTSDVSSTHPGIPKSDEEASATWAASYPVEHHEGPPPPGFRSRGRRNTPGRNRLRDPAEP
ncbi:hypothetical protein [Streptomyces microflavus]|uniref:hypothetical protein n=1 Tax=Streptomyces microflavus TaxID=1919 RepID=UPI0036392C9B